MNHLLPSTPASTTYNVEFFSRYFTRNNWKKKKKKETELLPSYCKVLTIIPRILINVHAHVPSNETLYEFIRQEFPLSRRGIVGGGARKQQRNDERVERKEYHLKGNSPSHRKTVPPQLAKPAFCRFAYGKKKKKTQRDATKARISGKCPILDARSYNGINNAVDHLGVGGNKGPCQGCAGVAVSDASGGRLSIDSWRIERFSPKMHGIVSCFVRGQIAAGMTHTFVCLGNLRFRYWTNSLGNRWNREGGRYSLIISFHSTILIARWI